MVSRAKKRKQAAGPAGYRREPEYTWFELPSAKEGADPLKVRVQSNLSFGQKQAIPITATFQELFEATAPYVIEWNYTAYNHLTGEIEPVPAPAESSPEALMVLDEAEIIWLAGIVKNGNRAPGDILEATTAFFTALNDARKNGSGPSESGPGAGNSTDSATT